MASEFLYFISLVIFRREATSTYYFVRPSVRPYSYMYVRIRNMTDSSLSIYRTSGSACLNFKVLLFYWIQQNINDFFLFEKKEEKSSFDIKLSCIERFSPRTLTWFNIIDFNRNTFKTNVHCSMYVYIHISWILKHLHTIKHLSYYMYMNMRTHIHTQSGPSKMTYVYNGIRVKWSRKKWYTRSICTLLYINFDGLYIIMNSP